MLFVLFLPLYYFKTLCQLILCRPDKHTHRKTLHSSNKADDRWWKLVSHSAIRWLLAAEAPVGLIVWPNTVEENQTVAAHSSSVKQYCFLLSVCGEAFVGDGRGGIHSQLFHSAHLWERGFSPGVRSDALFLRTGTGKATLGSSFLAYSRVI